MPIQKRSVTLHGHRTSVSLEPEFWAALGDLARARGLAMDRLVAEVDDARVPGDSLSSALRVHVLAALRQR